MSRVLIIDDALMMRNILKRMLLSAGYEICGEGGFGYDPIFYIPELGETSAEISADEKNMISHRGKALREMKEVIRKMMW